MTMTMTMPCRITDENVYNPWEGDANQEEPKTIHAITLPDLMGEEFNVWMKKNQNGEYTLCLEDESYLEIEETNVSPCALETMALFCKRFLLAYEYASEK